MRGSYDMSPIERAVMAHKGTPSSLLKDSFPLEKWCCHVYACQPGVALCCLCDLSCCYDSIQCGFYVLALDGDIYIYMNMYLQINMYI